MLRTILGLAAAGALALTLPAIAQQKAPEKAAEGKAAEGKKVDVPKGIFYAGLGPTQYLAKTRLIGQPVVDKSGARIAVVDDIILGTKDDKIDGLIIEAGGKKYGVRITAAKVETKDGKTTVTLPNVTAEILKSGLPPFGAKPAGN